MTYDRHALITLATEIHASNVTAGWWTDLKTGESILRTRNRPEMLMLAVSELAPEATEGLDGRMDDKLPHLPMFDVELADFVIRQLDQIGAEMAADTTMPPLFGYKPWDDYEFDRYDKRHSLLHMVGQVGRAMEHYRKGRVPEYVEAMADGVIMAFDLAEAHEIDLLDIIAQKRAFNAVRADHQVENRQAQDGKKF